MQVIQEILKNGKASNSAIAQSISNNNSINFKSTYMATYRFQKDDFLILSA